MEKSIVCDRKVHNIGIGICYNSGNFTNTIIRYDIQGVLRDKGYYKTQQGGECTKKVLRPSYE